MPKKILVAGGDLRQYYLSKYLASQGFNVSLLGFDELAATLNPSGIRMISVPLSCDALILPPLSSADSQTLYAPHDSVTYELSYLLQNLSPHGTVFHGTFPHGTPMAFEALGDGVRVTGYASDEEYAAENAFLTAEGALSLAVTETDTSLCGAGCLIRGFGRIGKALLRPLLSLGARVCVLTGSEEKRVWCRLSGIRTVTEEELPAELPKTDFIFNTAPDLLFDKTLLPYFAKSAAYIELASAPFGIDFKAAEEYGIRVVRGGGLPGRFSPKSAGIIEARTVMRLMKEVSS